MGDARLGIVDWGIGGLGLLGLLDQVAPGLPVTYWSDSGTVPYGMQRSAELAARLRVVVSALAESGCTEVVLACNAASTVVDRLQEGDGPADVPVPVEGIITHGVAVVPPMVRGVVGIVGGARTIRSGGYRRGLTRPGREVRSRIAQPLSAHIEAGRTGTPAFVTDLRQIVAPLRGADAVVLACTHYPAAADWFAAELPGTVLLDPAAHLAAAIAARHLDAAPALLADRTFTTTGDPDEMRRSAALAWKLAVPEVERRRP